MTALKKAIDLTTCNRLLTLVSMGKARIIKEHGGPDGVSFIVRSSSGTMLGIAGKRYQYLFESELERQSSNDGLFTDMPQTTRPVSP
jgi:hypothetical protein